jgi:hypothetical protein
VFHNGFISDINAVKIQQKNQVAIKNKHRNKKDVPVLDKSFKSCTGNMQTTKTIKTKKYAVKVVETEKVCTFATAFERESR